MSTTIKQVIDGFLLSCKVEGKSYGAIDCYVDRLKGFLWYATNYNWPDGISEITTQDLREFLGYLRETALPSAASYSLETTPIDSISTRYSGLPNCAPKTELTGGLSIKNGAYF